MSGVKHTPWEHEWVEESSDWAVFGCVYPPEADGIAHQPGICTLSDFCDEDEARLIAAAPDLLEDAMRRARECGDCNGTGRIRKPHGFFMIETDCPACGPTRAAIARARGES